MKFWIASIFKFLLLGLAAVPLVKGIAAEVQRLQHVNAATDYVAYPNDAEQAAQELAELPHIDFLRQADLFSPVVTLGADTNGIASANTEEEKSLAQAITDHALLVADTEKFVRSYRQLRVGSPLPSPAQFPFAPGHTYFESWHRQFLVVQMETRIVNLRQSRPDDIDPARELLDEYRKLSGFRAEFYTETLAEVEGYTLRYLQPLDIESVLTDYFKNSTDQQVALGVRQTLDSRLATLENFTLRYQQPREYVDWAKQEAKRCQLARDILRLDRTTNATPLEQRMAAFSEFMTNASPDEAEIVVDVVTEMIHALCNAELSPALELDTRLHVLRFEGDTRLTPTPREDVIIVWNDRTMEWMSNTEFDEYNLPLSRVHRLILRDTGTRPPLLRPTPHSEAAMTYNRIRASISWDQQSLADFVRTCEPHQNELGAVWKQLTELQALTIKYPVFFQSETESEPPDV